MMQPTIATLIAPDKDGTSRTILGFLRERMDAHVPLALHRRGNA